MTMLMSNEASGFSFIGELCESRSFSSKRSIDAYNYEKLSGFFYLSLVGLLLLSKLDDKKASRYAIQTTAFGNFNKFRISINDLYMLTYTMLGNNDDYKYASVVEDKSRLSELDIKRFLAMIKSDANGSSYMPSFFYGLERQIRMTNGVLRNIRRGVVLWEYKNDKEQEKIMSDLLHYLQRFSPTSDMKDNLKKVCHA